MTPEVPGIRPLFFIGGNANLIDEPDVVVVNASDEYAFLPSKVLAFFRHALLHEKFDWLFKCDDDTYVAMHRLAELAECDHDLVGNHHFLTTKHYASGGAGYMLSRRYVEILVNESQIPAKGSEDLLLTKAALAKGARAHPSKRLLWDGSNFPRPGNSVVTAHWLSPEKLRAIHTVMHSEPERCYTVRHCHWRDQLSLFGNGYYARNATGCLGRWEETESKFLQLRWFDWGTETVEVEGRCWQNNKMRLTPAETPRPLPAHVPSVIHALWFGTELPSWVRSNVDSWKVFHPSVQLQLWDDSRLEEALSSLTKEEREKFRELPQGVLQTTILRFSLLRQHGGIYADADMPCLASFLHLIPEKAQFGCGQKPSGGDECAFLFSVPGHPFLDWQIQKSFSFWESIPTSDRLSSSKEKVVWPFNAFDRRVPEFFGQASEMEILVDGEGQPWGQVSSNGLLRLHASRLHGERSAFAHHQYKGTWWPERAARNTRKSQDSKGNVAIPVIGIRGAGFVNKGAESMLKSVITELEQRLPCEFLVNESSPDFGGKVDLILDLSGFAYSSRVSWQHSAIASAREVQQRHQGVPWIFLSQTLGPFQGIEQKCRELFNGHLVCARDDVSYQHLQNLGGDFEHVTSPDVTWNFKGNHERGRQILVELQLNPDQPLIGIGPNMRAYERSSDYLPMLIRLVERLRPEAQLIALPHEFRNGGGKDDRYLCRQLGIPTIEDTHSAEELKGVISHFDLLVGSRFHALLAGLSMGIPVVALGWAHKYEALLGDIGLSEFSLSPQDSWEECVLRAWSQRELLSGVIEREADKKRNETTSFFDFLAGSIRSMSEPRWQSLGQPLKQGLKKNAVLPYFNFRRDVHRLEKGLALSASSDTPRIFGQDYLNNLLDFLGGHSPCDQVTLTWAVTVLDEYFAHFPESESLSDYRNVRPDIPSNKTSSLFANREREQSRIPLSVFCQLTRQRKSVRHFLPEKPDPEIIKQCFAAAMQAPTACNRQSFRFLYYTGKSALSIANIPFGAKGIHFPALMVLVARYDGYFDSRDIKCPIIDASLACMNFMLALECVELSSLPINFPELPSFNKEIRSLCALDDSEVVVMLLGIGRPDPDGFSPSSTRRPVEDILVFVE